MWSRMSTWNHVSKWCPASLAQPTHPLRMEVENELAEKLLHLEKDEYQKEAEIKERQLSDMREKLDEQLKTNKKLLEELQVKEAEV